MSPSVLESVLLSVFKVSLLVHRQDFQPLQLHFCFLRRGFKGETGQVSVDRLGFSVKGHRWNVF